MALGGEQFGLLMNTMTFLCHCRVETHPDPSFSRQRVGDGDLEALDVAGSEVVVLCLKPRAAQCTIPFCSKVHAIISCN